MVFRFSRKKRLLELWNVFCIFKTVKYICFPLFRVGASPVRFLFVLFFFIRCSFLTWKIILNDGTWSSKLDKCRKLNPKVMQTEIITLGLPYMDHYFLGVRETILSALEWHRARTCKSKHEIRFFGLDPLNKNALREHACNFSVLVLLCFCACFVFYIYF